jgi:ribose transport system substrate-binding protein
VAVTACGSSSGSSSTAGSGASSKGDLTTADKLAAQWAQRPTQIPVSQPIGKPIPTGKRIDFINCGVTACTSLYKNLNDAAKTLGWTVKQINTTGTPESVQAAWKQAVTDKPDAVVASGFPRAVFSQQLKQLQQMKIPVVESSTDDVEGGGIDLILSKPKDLGPEGQILASWITKDSGGKAHTLYVDLPVYNILKPVRQYFEANYAKLCAGCKLDKIDIPLTAIGKDVPDRVVSYLRAHPDVNYVAYSLGALNVGDAENYQYIASGQTHAALAFSNIDQTWVWAVALARLFTGQPIDVDRKAHLPYMLITKDNLISTGSEFPLVKDYQEQWKKLWGK